MPDNMKLYNAFRSVPQEAKKAIKGGRLNGKTDINPMWRIKSLTEQFGPCGIGWWYEITDKRLELTASGETAAFVDINLYYMHNGEKSMPVPGSGGSMFIAKEKSGLYVSDECFKMALTDAISVACKALGVGADVYWDKDRTKYDRTPKDAPKAKPDADERDKRAKEYLGLCKEFAITKTQLKTVYNQLISDGLIGDTNLMLMPKQEYEDTMCAIENRLHDIGYKRAS